MNWLNVIQGVFKLIPYVVQGIEVIHAGESSETKLQLAQDALGIATNAASQVLSPDNEEIASAVSVMTKVGIQDAQNVIAAVKNQPAPTPKTA